MSEMSKWEKTMKNRDGNIKAAHLKAARVPRAPIRSGVGTVPVIAKEMITSNKTKETTKNFDPLWQTPSSIVTPKIRNDKLETKPISVPQAIGKYQAKDLEETERERGNNEFKTGNFTAAVKSYTKCLGLKGKNYIAFSNRAMAYLKLKEFARAVSDCNCALQIEPSHIKSLLRRATAYNALGKHRAALRDLVLASQFEPANKTVRSDLVSTKEQLRSAVNRAPMISLLPLGSSTSSCSRGGSSSSGGSSEDSVSDTVVVQGPDPRPPSYIPSSNNTSAVTTSVERDYDVDSIDVSQKEALNSWEVVSNDDKNGDSTCTIENSHVTTAVSDSINSATTVTVIANTDVTTITSTATTTSTTTATTTSTTTATTTSTATATTTSTTTAGTGTRVAIVCDDDSSDEENTTAPISTATTVPTTIPSTVATATTTPLKLSTTTTTNKKVRTPSTPITTTSTATVLPPIRSSYDLERELKLTTTDLKLTEQLFKRLKLTHMKKLLSDCLEPSVIYLLLTAVVRYYGSYKQKWYKIIKWYQIIKDLKRFVTLYALLSAEYVNELHNLLIQVKKHLLTTMEITEEEKNSYIVEIEDLLTIF